MASGDLRYDWMYASVLGIIGLLILTFNVWIGLIFGVIAVFFGLSSIKAGYKLGYIGIGIFVLILCSVVFKLLIMDFISNM